MGKNKLTDIILIEDDNRFAESLKDLCLEYRFKINHFNNANDGINELNMRRSKYKGIILDIKCPIKEGEIEKKGQLFHTLDKIDELEKKLDRFIPKVICTGNIDYYYDHEEVLMKKKIWGFQKDDCESMLERIKKQINNSHIMKLQKAHADIFNIFEKDYLPRDLEDKLLGLLKYIKTSNEEVFQNLKSSIRVILEGIFTQMKMVENNKIPEDIFYLKGKNNQIDFMGIINHLEKNEPRIITTIMRSLQFCSNASGSHYSEFSTSKYFFRGQTNMLLEILLWFDKWMDENKNN
jgi:hypothetical protein